MALLHLLHKQPDVRLVVAHYDHGIRTDSEADRLLVQDTAERYGLPFVYDEGRLGSKTSEAKAREARYLFLRRVQEAAGAQAIITAHHADDALETAVHNLLRGTGRKGLTSLGTATDIQRPLLHLSKADLLDYAGAHELRWREDSTNQDMAYRRNYLRHVLLPKLSETQKRKLRSILEKTRTTNEQLDQAIAEYLHQEGEVFKLDRQKFIKLPHKVALEVMAEWLRHNHVRQFDRKRLEQLVVAAKTAVPGKYANVDKHHRLLIQKNDLALVAGER